MKKIPSLFVRDFTTQGAKATNVVTPGCEWVMAGEGVATQKLDGTCCLVNDGELWKRYDAKHGKEPPKMFWPAQNEPDPITGHWPGWLPVVAGSKEDRWHIEAWDNAAPNQGEYGLGDGTYELCGPKINGNPERLAAHQLLRHGDSGLLEGLRNFDALREYLASHDIEGIVWHHEDGRMVKVKASDFGIKRGVIR